MDVNYLLNCKALCIQKAAAMWRQLLGQIQVLHTYFWDLNCTFKNRANI